jgi:hypothetical protein
MFLQRMLAVPKSLFSRKPPQYDPNAEACVILRRVRELMELTPATPLACGAAESVATVQSSEVNLVVDV